MVLEVKFINVNENSFDKTEAFKLEVYSYYIRVSLHFILFSKIYIEPSMNFKVRPNVFSVRQEDICTHCCISRSIVVNAQPAALLHMTQRNTI